MVDFWKTLRERVILYSKPLDQPASSDKGEAPLDGVDLLLHPLPIRDKTETILILNTNTIMIQFSNHEMEEKLPSFTLKIDVH